MKVLAASLVVVSVLSSGAVLAQEDPGLSSGGLAPPPAIEPEPAQAPPSATERQLERADREDAGRGLSFVFVNADVGYELLGLQTFSGDGIVDGAAVETTHDGLAFGGAIGVRLIAFTIGARFRLATFDRAQLWTLHAEGGFRIPIGRLEPYFTFGGGYASLGSFETGNVLAESGVSASDISVRGFGLRGSAGLDYYVGSSVSVGVNLSGDLLFLSRPAVRVAAPSGGAAAVYAEDGSSIGGATALMAVVGLHF